MSQSTRTGQAGVLAAVGDLSSDDASAAERQTQELHSGHEVWASEDLDASEEQASLLAESTGHLSDLSIGSSVVDLTESAPKSDFDFEWIVSSENVPRQPKPAEGKTFAPRPPFPLLGFTKYEDAGIAQANGEGTTVAVSTADRKAALPATSAMDAGSSSNDYGDTDWQQAGHNADAQDLAGPGAHAYLLCVVDKPLKEGEGTQNVYISYLVTTDTDFKSFQSTHSSVRRRFTDFVFLHKTLQKEYPQCAVPPLPDKHNMTYVRGDRFGQDFTSRRAHSLDRFLKRLTLHPVLRRAVILALFLESSDWNATMRSRPQRGMSGSEAASSSVLESWTDTFLNAFSKPHKTDKRFADVNDRATKLDEDLGTVSKTVARVAKREADLETDYADLATQFEKLAALEPGVHDELTKFAASVQSTSEGWKTLKEHTDQNYLGSLKDMESYILAVKALLKTREQKQLDFEGLTDYLNKAAYERDTLASHGSVGASGFLRQKIEDVRGVDHEQSRRERQRKLEVQISRLTTEVESSKKTSEAFDEEVVKEVQDFERIKAVEFRDTLGGLADAHIDFFKGNIAIWEKFVEDMEKLEAEGKGDGEGEGR